MLLGGRTFLRRVFEVAATSKSDEVFISLALLSVTGASLLTQKAGFSDTLGAFVSGILLSETNFKAQVEAVCICMAPELVSPSCSLAPRGLRSIASFQDIQPFRGLLLGLFFVTTGASLDLALLIREWPTVFSLFAGLLALKATVITFIGQFVGLSRSDSIKTGFILSQGGEFAFVLLALAAQLKVLPEELNKLLIIVVVLSMAATPLLAETGRFVANIVESQDGGAAGGTEGFNLEDPVLVCGFGDVGQAVANMFEVMEIPYVVFDMTVPRVIAAQESGFNVLYGDGSRPKVLHASGVDKPKSIAVCYTARQRAVSAVASLRNEYPDIPILARAIDIKHASELEAAGANEVILSEAEAGLNLGARLTLGLGINPELILPVTQAIRGDMDDLTWEMAYHQRESSGPPDERASSQDIYVFRDRKNFFPEDITETSGGLLENISGALRSAIGSGDDDDDDKPNPAGDVVDVQSLVPREKE